MEENYVKGEKASKILGCHRHTLYKWETDGKIDTIRTPGNIRMYNVNKYLKENRQQELIETDKSDLSKPQRIIYVRVSSHSQKDDLERQKKYMINKFPNHLLIEDIGSGINMNRKGLRRIIRYAIEGKVLELVVAHKDRLTRFGFELIEDIIREYSNGKIIILEREKKIEPEQELVTDMLQIMNIFVAKMNGLRKYKIVNENEKEINKNT
jgi:putative resolvase